MPSTVTLPLWLAATLILLAAWAVLDRLLVPSLRWLVRRRVGRVLDEFNTRLHIRLEILCANVQNAVHLRKIEHDAFLDRNRITFQARSGPPAGQRKQVIVGIS